MQSESLLFRQIHPNFLLEKNVLSSEAFVPSEKDEGELSTYDGDLISASQSFVHYTQVLGWSSIGVWGISNAEVSKTGLTSRPKPLPESPAHAVVDFGQAPKGKCRRLAKILRDFAEERGCLYSP